MVLAKKPRTESHRLFSGKPAPHLRRGFYPRASWQWLVLTEIKYGGLVKNVKRIKVSQHDPRSLDQINTGGMIGGDRMLVHGYAPHYANHLSKFKSKEKLVIIEVGILRGTGLALLCDLFPRARVVGLDIDLGHIHANMSALVKRGAFKRNRPELYEFDQLMPNARFISEMLGNSKIDLVIDDGLHSREAIMSTLQAFMPHLGARSTYFIEDNDQIYPSIKHLTDFYVYAYGELTVLEKRVDR